MNHLFLFKNVFSSTINSGNYLKKLTTSSIFVLAMLLGHHYVLSQTLTTSFDTSSLKVCRDTARLTVKLVNNSGTSISDGRFVIDLGTLVFSTFVGKTGSLTSPNINYISGVRDTFKLDGMLNDMDSIEFVLSIRTNATHLSGGPYTISTSFDHGGGSIGPVTNQVTVLRPSSPQLVVTYSGPAAISTCNTPVMFCDTIRNVSGNGFDVQNIRTSLFFPSGTTISDVTIIPATITYTPATQTLSPFSLDDGQTVVICYSKRIDCTVAGSTRDSISILHDPVCPGADVLVTTTSPSVDVNTANLSISGAPSGTTNVNRGDTLMYTMTINNTGPGATDSARHCVQGAANLQLIGVEISGSPLTSSASSPVGFTCFNLPPLSSGGSVMITEKWRVINCSSPQINTIARLADFGCNNVTCGSTSKSNNEVNVLIPMNSMRIDTRTPVLLSRCGAVDTVHVVIRNTAGPHDTLMNVISRLNLDAGFVQLGVSGSGVSYTGINDSISIPNILPQDSVKFYVLVRATCAVASGSYSFSFFAKNNTQPCIVNNAHQVNTSFVPVQSADLSITASTPATLTPFAGGSYTITNTVANGGNGAIDSVFYCVDVHPNATLTAITLAGMNIPVFSSSPTQTCYVISRTLLDAALGVGVAYMNTSIQVVETWTFNSCSFPAQDLMRIARFGCLGSTCGTSNLRATGVTFGDAIPEVAIAISSATRPACFVDDPSVVSIRVTNTGTAPLAQLVYTISAGNNSINVASIQIRNQMGNLVTDQMIDVTTSPAHCSGGVRTVRDTVRNVDIPAGSYVDIQYELIHNCACTSGCSTNNIYNSSLRINSYTENCGFRFNVDESVSTADFDAYINGYVEGTQDLFTSGSVQYTTTGMELDWFNNAYPNAYIETKFTLPQGIDYSPNSIVWTDPNGVVFPKTSENYMDGDDGAPDMVVVRWNNASRPSGFIFSGGNNFRFNVVSDCTERMVTGCSEFWDLDITAQTDLTIDPACTSCPTRCIWANPALTMRLHCPGMIPCTCEGMVFDNFQVERINFGIPDNNNDRNPDGAMINMALVERDRFITGDTLSAFFEGTVASSGMTFTHGFAIVDLDHANFIPLTAVVSIFDNSTSTNYTCNAVPLTADFTNSRIIADFSPGALSALGCSLPGIFTFENNDNINVRINYKVNDSFTGIQKLVTVPTQFYLSDMPFGLGSVNQCNVRQDRVSQIGIQREGDMGSDNFGACDLPDFFVRERLYLGGLSTDEFPYEIRQIGSPKAFTFTKPSEFEHRADRLGIRLTQNISPGNTNIVNLTNGTVPSSFINIVGDQLVLNTEGYLNSLSDPRIPTDEGFTIDYFPRVQGSCKSDPGIYSYTFSQILGVDSELFGKDTLQVNPMTKTFEYLGGAQFVASASAVNVTICSASEDVNINVRNLTNFNAPNTFLTLRSPSGGLVGFDLIDADNNMIIAPLPFGIYPLGNIGPNGSRDVILRVRANNCERDSLEFVAGWSCESYPTTLEEALCSDPSTVYFIPASSGLNLNVLTPAVDVITDLCNEVTYEVEILSTNLGFLRDIYFQAQFAPNETYVANTIQMAYPSVSDGGSYINIPNPTPIIGGFEMDVSPLNAYLNTVGLVGSKDLDSNKISIRFRTITSCNFVSGSRARFLTNAYSSCGDPLSAVSKTAARIRVTSEPPSFNVDLALGALTLNACNNQQGLSVATMVLNSGSPSVNDSIKYILPPGIVYVPGSYTPISNAVMTAPLISNVGGIQTLSWPFKPGLGLSSTISFSIKIEAVDIGQLCTDYTIVVQAYSTINDMCGAQTCNVGIIAGEGTQTISIVKPRLKFQSLSGTLTLMPSPTNQVKAVFNATLLNMGAALQAGSTINMDIYDDVDGNGSLSPGDVFVVTVSGTTSSVLLPNQTINLMGMGTFAAGVPSICSVIAVLDPQNTCTCDLETSFRVTPKIIVNMETEPEVCSGATLAIGPSPTVGYAVEWVSIDGSNLSLLSSTTTTPTNFSTENNTGTNQIIRYAIRTSGGDDCYVFDTIAITVFPDNMDVVSVQSCQNQSFSLPAATIGGTNYVWVPTTGLTFPGPDMRYAIITSVAPGLTTFSLTYTDANGCPASYDYDVSGIDCGTANTRIGDYVWFDVNGNGIQDMGELPIVGMIVNLYNANNGTIVSSTTTDAMGNYLFDFLPQGNYFVEFVPLNGFTITAPNQGMQGFNSVANTTTGRTPNYFLPLDSETLYVDAGMTATCNLEMNVTVGPCVTATTTTLKRVVTVDLDWEDNVYTYAFLNGSDTITVDVLGRTFKVPVNTVDGSHSFTFDWQPTMSTAVNATASFKYASMCSDNVSPGSFGPCTFDLALRKTIITPTTPAYKYGDTLQYRIEIFNQGSIPAANINIIDYKPAGLEFVAVQNPDWFQNPDSYSEAFIAGPILPGASAHKDIFYKIVMNNGSANAWTNFAEITYAEDNMGNDRSNYDTDSTPDKNPSNDAGGQPGTANDNRLDGNGIDDEDDHDGAGFNVFDLALRKTIATPGPYTFGQDIQFDITVYNQGNITANSFSIIDYIPLGYTFLPVNSPAWTLSGSNATRTIPNPLLPGTSVTIPIILRVVSAAPTQYTNVAEISSARDNNGMIVLDFDGLFDSNQSNDSGGQPNSDSDDALNGNGTGMGGLALGDEDNMDVARLSVPNITLNKSVVSIASASSGNVANNDVTFALQIENTGNETLTMLTLSDDFISQFGGSFVRIVTMPSIFSYTATTNPVLNPAFNGGVNDNIFNGMTGNLAPTQNLVVRLTLELNDVNPADPLVNEAFTSGKDRFDTVVRDTAQAMVMLPNCFLQVNCPTPAQGNFSCAGDVPDAVTTVATFNTAFGVNAIENFCATPTITFVDAIAGLGCESSPQTKTRTYTITDPGMPPIGAQSVTCTVIYTVVDTIKPVFMTPPCDLILECGAASNTSAINTWMTMNGKSVAMDNCDQNVSVTSALVENINTCGNTNIRKYSFTATDDCGNSVVAFGNVILEDRIAPVLTLPTAANSVNCSPAAGANTALETWLNSATATDQCQGTITNISKSLVNTVRSCTPTNGTNIASTYLFSVSDNCGNASTGTATFTINDNTAPTITAPANLTVACGQDIGAAVVDWLDNYTVTEACQSVTVRNSYTGILPNLCGGSQTVIWTVTDGCGATGSSSAMIVVSNDVTPPVFSNCPANITVNVDVDLCASNVVYSTPIATDCNNPVTVVRTSGIASGATFPLGVSTIVFTATDRCNNTSTCSFTITVVDTDVPSISCPSNDVVVCTNGSCVWPSTTALNPIGIENCPGANVTYAITGQTIGSGSGNVPTNTNFALGTSTITYTLTAANGQTASCSFNVVVNDCTAPVITCPTAQPVFECGSPTLEADINTWLATASATDNCTLTPTETVTRVNTINQCGNTEKRLYQITATDGAGNSSQCFVEVSITDNTAPIIATAAANLTVPCDGNGNSDALINWLNTHGGAVATDAACGNELTWSNNFTGLSNGCGGTGSATVIFTVSDACGNTNTTSATFTIEDTTNPTIFAPTSITLLCGSASNNAIVQGWLDSYRVSDACGNVTVTNNFTALPTTCVSGSNVVTITFTARDECGRTATATATITLIDNQRPIIMTPPTDLILECGANNTASINAWVTARGNAFITDNCDPSLTTTFVAGSAEPNCGSTTTTLYTLTAADDCGNSTVTYARLILLDRIAPVLTLPTAANSVNCSPAAAVTTALETWLNSATAMDQCQGTITNISKSLINTLRSCTPTNGTNIASTYLFSVSDNCGNATTGTATFTINDNTAPTIAAPANLTVACGQDIGSAVVDWLDNYTVTEACQTVTVRNNYTGILPNLCGGSQTVTWTVTDGCGATGSSSAMIIVSPDTTPPVFSNCPANITVNVDVDLCASNVVYSTPIATDCNNPVTVVRTSGITSGSTFPLGVSTIVFTATDRCNNTSTCSFTITVVDTDVPSISCPSNDVVVCTNGSCVWPSTAALNPIGIENCPGANVTYAITGQTIGSGSGSVPTNTNFALGTSVVTYTITAANGQTASCSFNVVVNDCTAPVITCPANLVLECAGVSNATAINTWLTSATATDNCTAIPVETTLLLNTVDQCGNSERRLYRFTATDAAGNKDECFAEVIIQDTTIPSISIQATDLTVDCDGNGNSEQLLNWLNNHGGAQASDLCGNVSWSNNFGSISDLCASTGATTVIFTVSDACGNTNTTSATFTIRDITDPVLSCPADITLECSNPFNNAIITAWLRSANAEDVCSGTLQVTNNYPGTFAAGCGLSGVHTVTFSTVDACGNDVTCARTVTINDTTLPIITSPAAPLTVECDGLGNTVQLNTWLNNNGGATASDLCSSPLQITWRTPVLVNTQTLCGGTRILTYRFVAVDACSNESLPVFSTFIIQDNTLPLISSPATDLVVECDGAGNILQLQVWLNAQGNAMASDICSGPVIWQYDLVGTQVQCGRTGTYTYRFTVTDACGNTSTTQANFIIIDTTSPQITTVATNFDAQCNGASNSIDILNWLNNNGFAQASDECNGLTWSNDYGSIVSDCGTTGAVTVTFTATDACGNSDNTMAIFSISDDTSPTWEKLPQNLTLTCDGVSDPTAQIQSWLNLAGGGDAKDSCSLVVYSNNFTALANGCSAGTGSALVTFTATDACGNTVTANATITVEDINAPYFVNQARDTTVECNGNGNTVDLANWLANHGGAVAEDACSEPLTWSNTLLNTIQNCGGTSTSRYSFTATDACGNTSVATEALFIIRDTTIPVFSTLPKDSVAQCDGSGNTAQLNGWLAANGGLVATDICGSIADIEYDLVSETDLCALTGRSLYRFTIIDVCGNVNTAEASFIIVDTIPPVISGGADINLEECDNSTLGNYPEFDFWLTNHAGATAQDGCGSFTWSNNYNPSNWVTLCGNTRSVAVTFYATDNCNNVDSVTYTFSVGDVSPPLFVNCPRPPVIVDAPAGWCSSFANFSPITATDNCSNVTVTQIDNTGYSSGSLFPVGTTILWYEAVDECGNRDTCSIKIIVNDFHTPPTIACPADRTVNNDITMCGAVVNNLAPTGITDNCVNNLATTYTIRDKDNRIVGCGFNNASGFKFPVGKNTVNYTIQDQPLLLITEVINDGVISGIEITNFGPARYDISCLSLERIGTSPEVFIVEDTILAVGGVYTHIFSNIPANSPGAYVIRFLDNFIDGVAINGFAPSDFSWSGSLSARSIYRTRVCDTNTGMDFRRADDCNLHSFGILNSGLPILPDNGGLTSLQSRPPSIAVCNFSVTVLDAENPYCAEFDTIRYTPSVLPASIDQGSCTTATFTIPVSANNQVADINIINLEGSYPDVSALTFKLVSPQGTEVTLMSGICPGTDNFDINLDDEATSTLASILCSPAGQNGTYKPAQPLKTLFGERVSGTWTLEIFSSLPQTGNLTQANLEVIRLMPYSQRDTMINNEVGECGASFTWQHARVGDNCCVGTIRVDYTTEDGINVPSSGLLAGQGGQIITQNFEVGTTTVTYTITDQAGNVSKCSFDIKVKDNEQPQLNPSSCSDITIQLLGGQCETTVVYPIITATDNCKIDSIQYNPPIGTKFPIGTTEVQLVIFDPAGNSDTCTFDVIVLPYIPASNSLACKQEINLSLDATCTAYITASMVLAGTNVGCYDNYCITLMNADGTIIGTNIDSTHKVDITHVGKQITVKICEDCSATANCCWAYINVEEKLIPQIECPDDATIQCNETDDPTFTGEPILKSCEPNLSITFEDEYTDNDYCGDPRAIIERIWTVRDDENNVVTCSQTITVERFEMSQIQFPADYVLSKAFDCDDVVNNPMLIDTSATGQPTIDSKNIYGDHLCEFNMGYWDERLTDVNCKNSYEILRHWTIRDECSPIQLNVNPMRYIQAIKVNDRKAPVFNNCFKDITISTIDRNCTGEYTLPSLAGMVSDGCGDLRSITVTVDGGTVIATGYGVFKNYRFTNMAVGSHTVKIRATDLCKNTAVCQFDILVVDDTAPNVICDNITVVALSNDGTAVLKASVIDDGSFDNCGDVRFQIYRMVAACGMPSDTIPGDDILLCCEDITNGPIQVMLRVWDDADGNGIYGSSGDNYAECMTLVRVEYKLAPDFVCPSNVTINCTQDFEDLNITGKPDLYTACNAPKVLYTDLDININDCGIGSLTRRWSVENNPGVGCDQKITIIGIQQVTIDSIVWPSDTTVTCLDILAGQNPLIRGGACDQVAFQMEVDTFNVVSDACYKILKHWTVIDWCQYEFNNPNSSGKWTHTQTIKVIDKLGPVITNCPTDDIIINAQNCTVGSFTITASATDQSCGINQPLKWNYAVDIDNNGSIEFTGTLSGNTVNKTIISPNTSMAKVYWSVTDGCNNVSNCIQYYKVKDTKAPQIYCKNLAITISGSGDAIIWASDFDNGSADECTPKDKLRFSLSATSIDSSRVFTCADIPNGVSTEISVSIWVYDESGNKASCNATLSLQDNANVCPNSATLLANIAGRLATEAGQGLDSANVVLQIGSVEPSSASTLSNEQGNYMHMDNAIDQHYVIKPEHNVGWLNGVSTLDLVLIQRHILDIDPLKSPYIRIAADVNNDGKITAADLVALRKLILGIQVNVVGNESWKFVPKSHVFVDPKFPFPYPSTIILDTLKANSLRNDFVAVKIADINMNADPDAHSSKTENRSAKTFDLRYKVEQVQDEQNRVKLTFYASEDVMLHGLQMSLNIFGESPKVTEGSLSIGDDDVYYNGREWRISFTNDRAQMVSKEKPLFDLEVDKSNWLTLNAGHFKNEVYTNEALDIQHLKLVNISTEVHQAAFIVDQNVPNPFRDQTSISFELPVTSEVRFEVKNIKGELLYSNVKVYEKGRNTIEFKRNASLTSGVYYYTVTSSEACVTYKMILVE